MGKKPQIEPQPVKIVREPPLRGLDVPDGLVQALGGLAVVLFLVWLGVTVAGKPAKPKPPPWPGWAVLGWVLVAVLALAALAGLGFLVYWIVLALQRARAEVDAERIKARTMKPEANGLYPWLLSRDGDAAANLNTAPAGIVEGLNGGKPVMPDPVSDDARRAANRAAAVQLVAAAGSARAAGAAVEAVLQPGLPNVSLPPALDGGAFPDLLAHIEAEYKLLEDGVDDDLDNPGLS